MPTIFIATIIKGVSRYVKFTEQEQDAEDFEEKFTENLIDKGMQCFYYLSE